MENTQFLQWAATLGVGGVLALAMFLIHRKDMLEVNAERKGYNEQLITVVKENTRAITAIGVLVEVLRNDVVDAQARRGVIDRRNHETPAPTPQTPAPASQSPIIDRILGPESK